MDTFGSIIDKITILEKRKSVIEKEDIDVDSITYELNKQYNLLFKELIYISSKNISGERPVKFKKFKQYDKNINIDQHDSLIDLFRELKTINSELWEIEDKRRDTNYPDKDRLRFSDLVSVYNKKRNDTIDRIDELIEGILGYE